MKSLRSISFGAVLASLVFLALVRSSQAVQAGRVLGYLPPEQAESLSHMRLVTLDDGTGTPKKTLRITGLNVQIVNGTGSTETANGLGNLIVGYNEAGSPSGDVRTGSHNIVTGRESSFSSYGGVVAGYDNRSVAPYATVIGGEQNAAAGFASSVTAGIGNRAEGSYSSVTGGDENVAYGYTSSISGGLFNEAHASDSSISGGISNVVQVDAQAGSITGGRSNVVESSALFGTVSGGLERTVFGR